MTFKEFKNNFENDVLPKKQSFIREGQCLMNYLANVWFEEYKRISSVHYYDETDIDCFYNDKLIENTWRHLEKVWNK